MRYLALILAAIIYSALLSSAFPLWIVALVVLGSMGITGLCTYAMWKGWL